MTTKFRAVIFDLDGTLLNTLDDLADSANHVLRRLGLPEHDTEKYKYFVGNGIPKLIERILPADRQELHGRALEMFSEHYGAHSRDKTAPYDGIKDMLVRLRRLGLPLGVITNKAHLIALDVVDYYFGKGCFDCVRGLDDTIKAKPSPDGALDVAAKLGVQPSEVLYLGDTKTDMQTAVNAGFVPCGVLWGFRKRDELEENGAKYIISAPDEIFGILDGENA
ncbi:MAG: HAD family hydrolase [Eubacterium sp.]|nr:HAD family hydrolase [Eubacterium sp.]